MILAPEDCGCEMGGPESASIVNTGFCSGTFLFMALLEGFLRGRCSIATPCSKIKSTHEVHETYDFIVVGSGPGGSVVAGRLSENKNFKVLLLEAGPDEPIGSRVPGFYRSFWTHPDLDWGFRTVPSNDYCKNEKDGCIYMRGKVFGGSNAINGLMYHRGHPADYDAWVEDGAEGWSWQENLPYFLKHEGNREIGSLVSANLHNDAGPMPVQRYRYQPELVNDLLNAINSSGLPIIQELNDPENPDGFAIAQTMNLDGQRYTAARAYLKPTTERPNFHLKLNAYVTKVIFELIDGEQRATGVEYIDETGVLKQVFAKNEVILSAGALKTPHILMISGVGPKETLEQFNIPVIANLPVGKNLINHFGMTINFVLTKLNNERTLDWNVLTEYLLSLEGPMTADSITQVSGLLYSSLADKSLKQPDIQYFFNGMYPECSETGVIGEPIETYYEKGTNISVNVVNLLPKSVGYLTIESADPMDQPLFYPNLFAHPEDMIVLKDGVRYLRSIMNSKILKQKYGIRLEAKTSKVCKRFGSEWSDKWVDCMARTYTDPQNHQMGTAAIGHVIDTELKVYGTSGLRVIDASAMPKLVTGNPQAAIMMLAERGAEMISLDWSYKRCK